jgi:hypothetical protein
MNKNNNTNLQINLHKSKSALNPQLTTKRLEGILFNKSKINNSNTFCI